MGEQNDPLLNDQLETVPEATVQNLRLNVLNTVNYVHCCIPYRIVHTAVHVKRLLNYFLKLYTLHFCLPYRIVQLHSVSDPYHFDADPDPLPG